MARIAPTKVVWTKMPDHHRVADSNAKKSALKINNAQGTLVARVES